MPTQKYTARSRAIAAARLALSLGIPTYNSKAVSTLGYIAQLLPPPQSLRKTEKSMTQRVLHLSNNVFPAALRHNCKDLGLPQCQSISVLAFGARRRAAATTLSTTHTCAALLNAAFEEFGPLSSLLTSKQSSSSYRKNSPVPQRGR